MSKKGKLLAACSGEAVALSSVPDEVFASGMLGGGVAIKPETGMFFSPVDGTVENITDTLHAYTIRSEDGLDLLLHIGIDTVELRGVGFCACVKTGDRVRAGDIIARADLDLIKEKGYLTVTPVIISNSDELLSLEAFLGKAVGGESTVLEYRK